MSDEAVKLGELATGARGRDAVHVAVVPVTAAEDVQPGWHVRLDADGRARAGKHADWAECVGIVDPFLRDRVKAGEVFWLCLYPGTVTGMRHVWQHPAFAPRPPERPAKGAGGE